MVETRQGDGNAAIFDAEWRGALADGDPRWLSYPAEPARTQTELFELEKARQVEALLRPFQSARILEYACGSAGMSAFLTNCGHRVVSADVSINALRLARLNAQRRCAVGEQPTQIAGDVFRLPFANESFDVVMSYGLLEHFTEEALGPLLRETNRVLRPGGLHIVDIIHGRVSVRTLATALNCAAATVARALRGDWNAARGCYAAYFDHYFENTLGPDDWARLLRASGLRDVRVQTCRPLPALALSGPPERAYVALLKAALPLWRWFDRADRPGLDALGWMYFAYGVKADA